MVNDHQEISNIIYVNKVTEQVIDFGKIKDCESLKDKFTPLIKSGKIAILNDAQRDSIRQTVDDLWAENEHNLPRASQRGFWSKLAVNASKSTSGLANALVGFGGG